ncbi:MAG: pirin family protein [Rhodocyclaceae bacterium]|nr:pirin family protein [Rhodocyclaceae bacterium]
MSVRALMHTVHARTASDGAGVRLRRSLGQTAAARLDPFLLLDEFASDNPDDYIAGFPAHPHRGFETLTYLIEGRMRHEDHLGHRGELVSGGAQWMSAGRGIIHSEMPLQERGRLHGFQLWINLPAREKMKPAAYRDITPDMIPEADLDGGAHVRLIAGRLELTEDESIVGPVRGLSTELWFVDIALLAGGRFEHHVNPGHNGLAYPFAGGIMVGPDENARLLGPQQAGILGDGDRVVLRAHAGPARCLLLAARPLDEPIVQLGPFVMNTPAEIEQAMRDFRLGVLTDPPRR